MDDFETDKPKKESHNERKIELHWRKYFQKLPAFLALIKLTRLLFSSSSKSVDKLSDVE